MRLAPPPAAGDLAIPEINMIGFLMVLGLGGSFTSSSSASASELVRWKTKFLESSREVLVEAAMLTDPDEIAEFKDAIARRHGPGYLGGLLSMLTSFESQIEFARRFDAEDPVYGTPAQIRSQSAAVKGLLMKLAMRRMSREDLRLVRARDIAPTADQMKVLDAFIESSPLPITAANLLRVWDSLSAPCTTEFTQP